MVAVKSKEPKILKIEEPESKFLISNIETGRLLGSNSGIDIVPIEGFANQVDQMTLRYKNLSEYLEKNIDFIIGMIRRTYPGMPKDQSLYWFNSARSYIVRGEYKKAVLYNKLSSLNLANNEQRKNTELDLETLVDEFLINRNGLFWLQLQDESAEKQFKERYEPIFSVDEISLLYQCNIDFICYPDLIRKIVLRITKRIKRDKRYYDIVRNILSHLKDEKSDFKIPLTQSIYEEDSYIGKSRLLVEEQSYRIPYKE